MKPFYLLLLTMFFIEGLMAQSSNLSPASFLTTGSARLAGAQCFQLTAPVNWQGGAVWYKQAISLSDPFEMELDLMFGCDDEGADGMVFIFHPSLRDGFQGEGIGFGGLYPAFGIEMDTYGNPHLDDPDFDHLALMKNGQMHHRFGITRPVSLLPNNKNIEDCNLHRVKIIWQPDTDNLKIYIDGGLRLNTNYDIVEKIFNGNPIVYWGISSATGGKYNLHKVCFEKLEFSIPKAFDNATQELLLDGDRYTLKKVEFPSGKSTLETESFEELDKLVNILKANPKLNVNVTGHTDSIGSTIQNKTISQKRADEVAKYLIEKGIDKWRIKATGFGEQFPKVDNATPENRKINRRIEIYLAIPEKA